MPQKAACDGDRFCLGALSEFLLFRAVSSILHDPARAVIASLQIQVLLPILTYCSNKNNSTSTTDLGPVHPQPARYGTTHPRKRFGQANRYELMACRKQARPPSLPRTARGGLPLGEPRRRFVLHAFQGPGSPAYRRPARPW